MRTELLTAGQQFQNEKDEEAQRKMEKQRRRKEDQLINREKWSSHSYFVIVCVLCPDRDSGDLPLCLLVCGIDRSGFVDFLQSMGADDLSEGEGWQMLKKWMEELLAKAITIDGRKEWCCRFCSETNVWTRSKCRRCQTNFPSVRKYEQAGSVQFQEAGEGGRFEEEGQMDVDESVDNKMRLDQRKKELQRQLCEMLRNSQMCRRM